jgi:hypothetical protein
MRKTSWKRTATNCSKLQQILQNFFFLFCSFVRVVKINVTRLGKILPFGHFYLNTFYSNEQFKNMICCTYFNFKKHLYIRVLDFEFDFFNFGCSLGHISKEWMIFQSSGDTDTDTSITKLSGLDWYNNPNLKNPVF